MYSLTNIIWIIKSRRLRWVSFVAPTRERKVVERRDAHRVLVGKPEGKKQLGSPGRRWEDNINMDLQEVGG